MPVKNEKYSEIIAIQERLNNELRGLFECNKDRHRDYMAGLLVSEVERIVDELNTSGHNFGRVDYDGDNNYERSEKIYSDGEKMGTGVVLKFLGVSVKSELGR